jgi:hypothetical protein
MVVQAAQRGMATRAQQVTPEGLAALAWLATPAPLGLVGILAQQGTPVALARLVLRGPQVRRGQGLQQGRLETPATLVALVALVHLARLGRRHLSFR